MWTSQLNTAKTLALSLSLAVGAASCHAQTAPLSTAPVNTLPTATELVSPGFGALKFYGQSETTSAVGVVPVQGQPFKEALRLTTISKPPFYYSYGASVPTLAPVAKGDTLWVSLWARRLTTLQESGEAQFEVALLQKVAEKEVRPLERVLSVGREWTQFNLPFKVNADASAEQTRLAFRFGYGRQSLEIGGVKLLNYGPNVKLEDLPRTQIRYEGWKPDSPWRRAAAERIEKIRKGDLTIKVVDGAGRPVPDAQITVRMKKHAFTWGTEVDDERINDTQSPDNERYRQHIEKYFNKAVFGNSLKWGRWIQPKHRESALKALPWFEARGIPIRGHVMVWPSWQYLPKVLFTEEVKKDPEVMKKLVADRIADQTATLQGRLLEWDVANETFAHHDLIDILGRDALADWFKMARAGEPKTRLFYNDYTMFQPGTGSDYFYNTIKELKEKGAPIDGIGEQGHFASSPAGIPYLLETLDKFSALGLPIQITEFDINTDDTGLQADFMRDFNTAMFSHPGVTGVMQWGFWEPAHWIGRAAMWDKDWNLRPHGQVWVDLTTKEWWTNADGKTARNGDYKTRGFYGDYEITVTKNGKIQTSKFALSPQNGALTVALR